MVVLPVSVAADEHPGPEGWNGGGASRGAMSYSVPRCTLCRKPALRDKRDAEEVAVAAAALLRGRLRCRSCEQEFVVDPSTEWVEIGED